MKALTDKVVVITGASSGIGRATALEFARCGARVVISARDATALAEVKRELESGLDGATGAREALPVVTDVTQEDQVERLAQRAQEAYGQIDIWVNNASVALFAKFDEAPSNDYRQIIETDFFGYVYGARAALRRFKAQGYGTIINVDSIEGITPKPYQSAYAAAKHAVRALASSLRMELALDGQTDINVVTVMPASVDTPLFAHAANYTGSSVMAPETATQPAAVARAITRVAIKPQRELILGGHAKRSAFQYLFMPGHYERRTAVNFPRRHLAEDSAMPGRGNLFESTGPHRILGGWTAGYNRPGLRRAAPWLAVTGAVVGLGTLAAWLLWPGRHRAAKLIAIPAGHR